MGAWETAAAMEIIVLSIHLLVCMCLIGLVLLQRSEGGALGMGGGGGGGLVSGRGAADALAKMTSVAGGFFLVTSLGLTMLSGAANTSEGRSVFDLLPQTQSAPLTPAAPEGPATTPEETPDPTESRTDPNTQFVTLGPSDASASTNVPPAASAATTRAGPIEQRPTSSAATQPRQTPASATTTPRTRATTPATSTAQQRSTPATTQPAATQPAPSRVSQLPPAVTNGAVSGIDLNTDPQLDPESSEGVQAVRRERAGPDQ
jgi:preprotein translocase subunit SecG